MAGASPTRYFQACFLLALLGALAAYCLLPQPAEPTVISRPPPMWQKSRAAENPLLVQLSLVNEDDVEGEIEEGRNVAQHFLCDAANWTVNYTIHLNPSAGFTGCFLALCAGGLDMAFFPILTSLPMFVVFLGLILHYHIFLHFSPRRKLASQLARFIGRAGIIFQIYYSRPEGYWKIWNLHSAVPFLGGFEFISSCWFTILDTWFLFYIFSSGHHGSKEEGFDDEKPILNVYMNLHHRFSGCVVLFLTQFCLMLYYIFYLNNDQKTKEVDNVSVVKWMCGVALAHITSGNESGVEYQPIFWKKLQGLMSTSDESVWFDDADGERFYTRRFMWFFPMGYQSEWWWRHLFDWFMNSMCRTLLLSTAPIVLNVEGELDFIKDAIVIFFIVRLDDLPEPKRFDDEDMVFKATQTGFFMIETENQQEREDGLDPEKFKATMTTRLGKLKERYTEQVAEVPPPLLLQHLASYARLLGVFAQSRWRSVHNFAPSIASLSSGDLAQPLNTN